MRKLTSHTRRLSFTAAAALTVLAVALSGCSLLFEPQPKQPASSADLSEQQPNWQNCGDEMQCATIAVPLDWSNPEGRRITLALVKHPASGDRRLGTVFVNPGGPGASGAAFVQESVDRAVSTELQQYYDVIGWDPRGVGNSAAVACLEPQEMDAYLFGIPQSEPRTEAWMNELRADTKQYGEACAEQSGRLLQYVDTISTARDLDLLRQIVGDQKLNYIGYSYGTLIGSIYAELFADRVGRMVLDGVLASNISIFELVKFQTLGFELALSNYLNWCLEQRDCPFTGTVDEAKAEISQLLADVEANPLPAEDGRELGVSTFITAIIYPLYDETSWSYLNQLFAEVAAGDTSLAFLLADSYLTRDADGTYLDNSNEAFSAINCLTYGRVTDVDVIVENAKAIEAAAPIFGKYQGYSELACIDWPATPVVFEQPIVAAGSDPILVIGTTGDPATPYQWAVDLADSLENGVLLTYNGEGHTAYNRSNDCVLNAVDNYMITGEVPANNLQC